MHKHHRHRASPPRKPIGACSGRRGRSCSTSIPRVKRSSSCRRARGRPGARGTIQAASAAKQPCLQRPRRTSNRVRPRLPACRSAGHPVWWPLSDRERVYRRVYGVLVEGRREAWPGTPRGVPGPAPPAGGAARGRGPPVPRRPPVARRRSQRRRQHTNARAASAARRFREAPALAGVASCRISGGVTLPVEAGDPPRLSRLPIKVSGGPLYQRGLRRHKAPEVPVRSVEQMAGGVRQQSDDPG